MIRSQPPTAAIPRSRPARFRAGLTSAIVDLYERRLGWKVDDRYELITTRSTVNGAGRKARRPESISALRRMLALDPKFRVLVVAGLTDVQTPYLATALELAQVPNSAGGPTDAQSLSRRPHGLRRRRQPAGAARRRRRLIEGK